MKLENLSNEALLELIQNAKNVLVSRKESTKFMLETCTSFDSRKHGHAYLAKVVFAENKAQREFLEHDGRQWDSKRKSYYTTFTFEAKVGDCFEARLDDGSWKNDYKEWFVVVETDGKLELKNVESLKKLNEFQKKNNEA